MSFVIAAKFRMIFLGSKVSGHQNLLPLGLRQQHALVTLPTLFSVTKLLSAETAPYGKIHRFSIFCSGPPNFKIFRGPLGPGPVGPWVNASLPLRVKKFPNLLQLMVVTIDMIRLRRFKKV